MDSVSREPRWADVLALPGTHLHLYGKVEARRGRKMGHVTCVSPRHSIGHWLRLAVQATASNPGRW